MAIRCPFSLKIVTKWGKRRVCSSLEVWTKILKTLIDVE